MKTATGEVSIDVWVDCPYCEEPQEFFDEIDGEQWDSSYSLTATNCSIVITCDDCKKDFQVTNITQ